jgi:predicted phage baseplate assembly protein
MSQDTDGCGCCGITAAAPDAGNPPGLAAIAYRSGTHGTVLRQMLAALGSRLPQLDPTATDDPAIALLDAWATVADIVTFYQERIANEGFLRTATERRSVLELARAIGYELRPGVAAAAYLDFRMQVPAAAAPAPGPAAPATAVVTQGTKVLSVPAQGKLPQPFETGQEFTADAALNEVSLRTRQAQTLGCGLTQLYLDGLTTGLRPGDPILVVEHADPPGAPAAFEFRVLRSVRPQPATAPDAAPATLVTWDDGFTQGFTQPEVYAFGVRAAMFGYNAVDWRPLPYSFRAGYVAEVGGVPGDIIATKWPQFDLPDAPQPSSGGAIYLDAVYPDIAANSFLVLRQPGVDTQLYRVADAVPSGQAKFAISAKSSYVTLDRKDDLDKFDRRQVAVHAATRQLPLAEQPIGGTVSGRELDLAAPAPLTTGQPVLITGTSDGVQVVQPNQIDSVAGTSVTLIVDLTPALDRESVRIRGNVVLATHGETAADEVLGSGDGTASNQRFTLRKPNLTYVAAKTPSGVADSLEIRVDDVLWTEVPSLYPAGPHDRVYVVRIADDATATVIFGDGTHGARLPTGQENVHARYRSGIGPDGLVDAQALTLLPQRPLGVATVDNPLASGGANAPETLAEARTNAPLTVLTLDRVVSLADYEYYAQSFGGIAKARAVSLPSAAVPTVFITVAGPGGSAVAQEPTIDDLLGALDTVRDRAAVVRADSFTPVSFRLAVQVLADPARLFTDVQAAVLQALETSLSADRLSFGRPVTAAAVIAATQAVDGVVAARLTELRLADPPPQPGDPAVVEVLTAPDAHPDPVPGDPGRVQPAGLLTLAPGQPDVGEWTP